MLFQAKNNHTHSVYITSVHQGTMKGKAYITTSVLAMAKRCNTRCWPAIGRRCVEPLQQIMHLEAPDSQHCLCGFVRVEVYHWPAVVMVRDGPERLCNLVV